MAMKFEVRHGHHGISSEKQERKLQKRETEITSVMKTICQQLPLKSLSSRRAWEASFNYTQITSWCLKEVAIVRTLDFCIELFGHLFESFQDPKGSWQRPDAFLCSSRKRHITATTPDQ
jgi:hypothetical protein